MDPLQPSQIRQQTQQLSSILRQHWQTEIDLEAQEQVQNQTHELQQKFLMELSTQVKSQNYEKSLAMGSGRPFPPFLPDSKHYLVEFDGPNDPAHPYNWNLSVK
jgi:hypothetical protein